MFRSLPILLILSALASGAPVVLTALPVDSAPAPVLRALPLGGDEDPNSRPVEEGEPLIPAARSSAPAASAAPTFAAATPIRPSAVAPPSPLELKPTGDDAIRLQIFLDDSDFGPGVIDGKPGQFTELAVQSWNEVHGHPAGDWTAADAAARKAVPNPLAVAVVPDFVKDWVDDSLPYKVSQQAKRKRMSYRSNGELMSERYHTSMDYLLELNGAKKMDSLKPRDTLIVPNVVPFQIEKITGAGYKEDPAMSQRHAVVDTKINQVRIFEAAPAALVVGQSAGGRSPNRGLIASFPITPGQPKFIKFGTWEVRNSVELPYWRYDQQLLDTGKRSSDSEALNIPPGPNSPVGIFWCGLSKPGIGLHGTSNPETIGRARSHGCIRLANWDAIRLPTLIRPGTTVEIR